MIFEIISAGAIILIALTFLTSSTLTMPATVASMMLILLILAFLSFAALLWKEKPADERESLHALLAGRISFLVGVGVLVIAVIVQATMHNIDTWLILTLCTMVVTKIVLLIYSKHKM